VLGRNDPRIEPQPAQCPAEKVGAEIPLSTDNAARQHLKRRYQREALDLAPKDDRAAWIEADEVKDVPADVDADVGELRGYLFGGR